jgi:hypothetical protein
MVNGAIRCLIDFSYGFIHFKIILMNKTLMLGLYNKVIMLSHDSFNMYLILKVDKNQLVCFDLILLIIY